MSSSTGILLSIVVCTYNRAAALQDLLQDLLLQIKASLSFAQDPQLLLNSCELLIVDNNSTDSTQQSIFNLIQNNSSIKIRAILEKKQGSSPTRNRGVKEALGKLVLFLDDDLNLSSNFFDEVWALAQTQVSSTVFAARVIPRFEITPPSNISFQGRFAINPSCFPFHDYGEESKSYPFQYQGRYVQNPISACFVITRDIALDYGFMREDLGIVGNKRGACEDTEFFWRLLKNNVSVLYYPSIVVYHPISESRLSRRHILDWYSLLGYTLEYLRANKLTHLEPNLEVSSELKLNFQLLVLYLLWLWSFIQEPHGLRLWAEAMIAQKKSAIKFLQVNADRT